MTPEDIREWAAILTASVQLRPLDSTAGEVIESAARALVNRVIEEDAGVCDAEDVDARAKYKLAEAEMNEVSMAICASAGMSAQRLAAALRARKLP